MKRTFEISCPGTTLADAFDQASGGWFSGPDVPTKALEAAKANGRKVYKFKMTLELIEELTPH